MKQHLNWISLVFYLIVFFSYNMKHIYEVITNTKIENYLKWFNFRELGSFHNTYQKEGDEIGKRRK